MKTKSLWFNYYYSKTVDAYLIIVEDGSPKHFREYAISLGVEVNPSVAKGSAGIFIMEQLQAYIEMFEDQ